MRYLGLLQLDTAAPVWLEPGGDPACRLEILSPRPSGVPLLVRAGGAALRAAGCPHRRKYPPAQRLQKALDWLLGHALSFRLQEGEAVAVHARPIDPGEVDYTTFWPVPVLGETPAAGPLPEAGPLLALAGDRLWGPFEAAEAGRLRPDRDGIASLPAPAPGAAVLPGPECWFIRRDVYEELVQQLRRAAAERRVELRAAAQVRRLAAEYERWAVGAIAALVLDAGFFPDQWDTAAELCLAARDGAVPRIAPGSTWAFSGPDQRRAVLHYDCMLPRTLGAAVREGADFWSASAHSRPDLRLDLYRGGEYRGSLVFDAKRRRPSSIWDEADYLPAMEQLQSYAFCLRRRDDPGQQAVRRAVALFPGPRKHPPWLEFEGGHVALARLAPGEENAALRRCLSLFLEG